QAPLIIHLLPINVGVKMQSILWFAWPPPGRSSTLKIASGSNIDDIRGNTTLVANCLYFKKFNYSLFFEICFLGWCPMLQLSTKKISLKPDTERRKYARFSGLVPFSACKLPRLSGLLSRMLTGTSYSTSTTNKCRSED